MTPVENHLIESLPKADRARLLAVCEPAPLVFSQVLCEAADPTRHVYFPLDGFISLVRPVDQYVGLEVGMIGREGMLGAELALGVSTAPLRALVQGGGVARRVDAGAFRLELSRSAALARAVHRYLYVTMGQLATSAACVRFHLIGARLARWLLMMQDRAHADSFRVTHEFLSFMLGVRRVGITGAASVLQRNGLISYRRGTIEVLDRGGLEAAACSCYQADRQAYAAWF